MKPLVIAHRGASGYRPEHTLAAYELAIRQGWFTEDFSLEELKTLRARERIPALRPGNAAYDDLFDIPTLREIIDLAKARSGELGRAIGICPETKHPGYFASIGLPMAETLLGVLHSAYGSRRDAPVFVQSFEVANLQKLRGLTDTRLIQLLDAAGRPDDFVRTRDTRTFADLATPAGLDFIKGYANGIGVHKDLIIPRNPDGTLAAPTPLVADGHARGLVVYGWTFRAENEFLPAEFRCATDRAACGDLAGEIAVFLGAGVDGFFTDQPDAGVALARRRSGAR